MTSRTAWRRLAQGIAILFLLTHQGWDGIVCHCRQEDDAQMAHACCLAAHHSGSAVSTEQMGEVTHESAPCSEEGAPGNDDQFGALPQSAMVCCHDAPQAEQNAAISLQETAPVVSTQPLVSLYSSSDGVFIPYQFHQLYRTRPLYLSISCLLI